MRTSLSPFRPVRLTLRAASSAMLLLAAFASAGAAPPATELPSGVDGAWWSAVQDALSRAEYDVRAISTSTSAPAAADVRFRAPNRAQRLRAEFANAEVRLAPGAETGAWSFGMAFAGLGRGEDVVAPMAATVAAEGNRVSYRRGNVEEWYVNDARGLEQGFTIATRPAGAEDELLRVVLGLSGDLAGSMDADRAGLLLRDPFGVPVLQLSKLYSYDASGRDLPSCFELDGDRLSIVVDDAGALYPIVIDPLATSPNWSAEGNQPSARFGYSVSGAGDVNGDGFSDVIVGAPDYSGDQSSEGRAFVYLGSSSGLAALPSWTVEGNQTVSEFGIAVSAAGDVNGDGFVDVMVGAASFTNDQALEGRAFVYHGSALGLATIPAWMTEGNQVLCQFGASLSAAGDVNGDGFSDVIIGAPLFDNGQNDEGRAFVYHGSAGGLGGVPAWTSEGQQNGAQFAVAVAMAGDVNGDGFSDVIVGAPGFDNGEADEGRGFVYHGSSTGLAFAAAWTIEPNQIGAALGASVSTAGDVNGDGYSDVLLGATHFDNSHVNEGGAFVYLGAASGLATVAAWTAESNQAEARLGSSVSMAGDVNGDGYADVVVGAPFYDGGAIDNGRAYVYLGAAGGLELAPAWTDFGFAASTFGSSVRTAGDVNGDGFSDVIVGAPTYGTLEPSEGRAHVYHGAANTLAPFAAWQASDLVQSGEFGTSVALAGDVNGDGYADVIVGAPYQTNPAGFEGAAFVYYGTDAGLPTNPDWTAESDQMIAQFGYSVASAGDVNGDGFADVIIGAPLHTNQLAFDGAAYVYLGSSSGLALTPSWFIETDQNDSRLGSSVASAGDVNGDGYSDVIVGAPFYDAPETNEGRAYVYLGSATGLAPDPIWAGEGNQMNARYGWSVADAGDVDGDGFGDVIVGALGYTNGQSGEGRAFVHRGSPGGPMLGAAWMAEGDQPSAMFGRSVAPAGDVNGDGFSDVIIGAAEYDNGQLDEGLAFVYQGTTNGLALIAEWVVEVDQASALFGWSVSTAGDVDGDGFSDVIVGAPGYGFEGPGGVFVYHGSSTGLSTGPEWTKQSDLTAAEFGASVSTAGDVTGDGFSDVIIGAPRYVVTQIDEGWAFVHYGNDGPGRLLLPRQRDALGVEPIERLGTAADGAFRMSAQGWSATGRADVGLETEVRPLGTAFDGTGTKKTGLVDAGTIGVALARTDAGLAADTGYRWRARVLSETAKSPYQRAGRWFGQNGSRGVAETDVRTEICPNTPATTLPYGAGKPGTNGVPVLFSVNPPVLGGSSTLKLVSGAPNAGPAFLFLGLGPASVPFDGGVLLVVPALSLNLPSLDVSGELTLPAAIVRDAKLCGVSLYMQVFVVDPGAAGFYHTAQSNALWWIFGK